MDELVGLQVTHECSPRRTKLIEDRASKECNDSIRSAENRVGGVDRGGGIGLPTTSSQQIERDVETAGQTDENTDNEVLPGLAV